MKADLTCARSRDLKKKKKSITGEYKQQLRRGKHSERVDKAQPGSALGAAGKGPYFWQALVPGLLLGSGGLLAEVLKSDFSFCSQVRFLSTSYLRAEVSWCRSTGSCPPAPCLYMWWGWQGCWQCRTCSLRKREMKGRVQPCRSVR